MTACVGRVIPGRGHSSFLHFEVGSYVSFSIVIAYYVKHKRQLISWIALVQFPVYYQFEATLFIQALQNNNSNYKVAELKVNLAATYPGTKERCQAGVNSFLKTPFYCDAVSGIKVKVNTTPCKVKDGTVYLPRLWRLGVCWSSALHGGGFSGRKLYCSGLYVLTSVFL